MPNITKRDIVERVSEKTGLTQVDVKMAVEAFQESIGKTLSEGKNIEIRGFGQFKVRKKKARMARNPRTGEAVKVAEGFKPVFKASSELIQRVNSRKSAGGNGCPN